MGVFFFCLFVFLPGAVQTVDFASERHPVVGEEVLCLLGDAGLFVLAVRHLVLHLGCGMTSGAFA